MNYKTTISSTLTTSKNLVQGIFESPDKSCSGVTLYKFNGKELDQETGMYYYGARYYSPELSIWASVDPLSDKYPSMSPFMYCAGNPVKLIDIDGRKIVSVIKIDGVKYKFSFDGNNATIQQMKGRKSFGDVSSYNGGNKYADNIISSYRYIVENGADVDNAMQQIASSDFEVRVSKGWQKSGQSNGKKIAYDFDFGLKIFGDNGLGDYEGNQSPALGFWSEIYHSYISLIDKDTKKLFRKDTPMNDKQEDYVHVKKEGEVIDILNSKGFNETKRTSYPDANGEFKAKNCTSTQEME